MSKSINGDILRDMLISGAANIEKHKNEVNDMNVFPVPDGDTGTNMSLTIGACSKELRGKGGLTVGEVSKIAAGSLLRGARGNSGVILSLIFRGFSKGLAGKEEAGGADLAESLAMGVKSAYKAVMKPTEGTILTVVRESADKGCEFAKSNDDAAAIMQVILDEANASLARTPELLPVLKEAGVVDAGGMGLIKIFEGMMSVVRDGVIIQSEQSVEDSVKADFRSFDSADIKYAYCTEFIVNKEQSNRLRDPQKLRAYLEFLGDSVVVADDEELIKCHVHTNNPGKAIEEALKYGYLSNMKIENMKEQLAENSKQQETKKVKAEPGREFGFVAVAAGDGIAAVFKDLAVDEIAYGGQTMNPSTEDILTSIDAVPAKTVFVLPNNKNIILAAEQAVPLTDKNVIVLPTKTIPQGISAMLAFDETASAEDNKEAMLEAVSKVKSGQITYAVRDSIFDGKTIKEGEMLCILENKVKLVEKTLEKAAVKLAVEMCGKDSSYMLMMYGADVEEQQAEAIKNAVEKKVGPNVEITLVNGGQAVYYFIFSVE